MKKEKSEKKQYKKGELEAKEILELMGIQLSHNDDNSERNIPDFKFVDTDECLEVTHTKHNYNCNNTIFEKKIQTMNNKELCKAYNDPCLAYDRLKEKPKDISQYKKDVKTVKEHYGYDAINPNNSDSKNRVNIRTFEYSVDNIIDAIKMKNEKHKPKDNISLFCFVTEDEFNLLNKLMEQDWNGERQKFLKQIDQTVFKKIFICKFYFNYCEIEYDTKNPELIVIDNENNKCFKIIKKCIDITQKGAKHEILYVKKENKNLATDLRLEYFKKTYKTFTNKDEITIRKNLDLYFDCHLNDDCYVVIIREDSKPVSSAILNVICKAPNKRFPDGRYGEIYGVYTTPNKRHNGYATKLIQELLIKAKELNLPYVELDASVDGKPIYQKCGFVEEHSDYTKMKYYC